jgi:hypothetical protein
MAAKPIKDFGWMLMVVVVELEFVGCLLVIVGEKLVVGVGG